MRSTAQTLACLCLLVAAPAIAQEQAPTTDPATKRQRHSLFMLDVPSHWRTATPDDAFAMRGQLPYEMSIVYPDRWFSIGDVDRWRAGEFDGRAIVVRVQDGEIPIEEASIEQIREHTETSTDEGPKRTIENGEIVSIGKDGHPAIRCRVHTEAEGDGRPSKTDEYYIPTSGRLLILGFRAWEDDFESASPMFDEMVGSAAFLRQPRGAEELGDRLTQALMVGAIVGLALIALRMMRKRQFTEPPPPA